MSTVMPSSSSSARLEAQRPKLTPEQEQAVFRAACELVAAAVQNRRVRLSDMTLAGAADITVMGAFVTLKRQGKLRACWRRGYYAPLV